MEKEIALNDRQKLFVAEYCKCLNATRAAIKAGYSEKSASNLGARNMANPEIRKAIDATLGPRKMSSEEVIARLEQHAIGNMGDFLSIKEKEVTIGTGKAAVKQKIKYYDLDLDKADALGVLHLIREIKIDPKGGITLKLHDAQRALELLARHHYAMGNERRHPDPDEDDDDVTNEEIIDAIDELIGRPRSKPIAG